MAVRVTSREANQQFSKLLERVRNGEEIVVTKHGKPAMRMVPVTGDGVQDDRRRRTAAANDLVRMMVANPIDLGGRRLTAEDYYD
jgi:prevent-host-death family protein